MADYGIHIRCMRGKVPRSRVTYGSPVPPPTLWKSVYLPIHSMNQVMLLMSGTRPAHIHIGMKHIWVIYPLAFNISQ